MAEPTQTIYARVPVAVKAAIEEYRAEHGKTLAGAVTDLLRSALAMPRHGDGPEVWEFTVDVRPDGISGSIVRR